MILFVADNHYNQHCGRHMSECLKADYEIEFHEDDWSCFSSSFADKTDLLVLNMIADTCGLTAPRPECEGAVQEYLEDGKPMLLLHGASAAFWHWDWWRPIVGYRWVRGNDPDSENKSWHPVRPYKVTTCNSRHPLAAKLQDLELPEDEIYLNLEQTSPCWNLMETNTDEGIFPMCYETTSPWGGRIIGFLPGHNPAVTTNPGLIANLKVLIDDLLG